MKNIGKKFLLLNSLKLYIFYLINTHSLVLITIFININFFFFQTTYAQSTIQQQEDNALTNINKPGNFNIPSDITIPFFIKKQDEQSNKKKGNSNINLQQNKIIYQEIDWINSNLPSYNSKIKTKIPFFSSSILRRAEIIFFIGIPVTLFVSTFFIGTGGLDDNFNNIDFFSSISGFILRFFKDGLLLFNNIRFPNYNVNILNASEFLLWFTVVAWSFTISANHILEQFYESSYNSSNYNLSLRNRFNEYKIQINFFSRRF